MENTGLNPSDIERIKAIFSAFPEIKKVILYGSRAMGNFKPSSDIDIALIGNNIDLSLQQSIELELDDLMLPYKFDVTVYNKLTNPEFIKHIRRVGKELYHKPNPAQ